MKKVDTLLIPIIRNLGIKDDLRLAEIKKNWYILFPEPLSHHMAACKLSEGEILIAVDSAIWLQELQFYRNDIIKKLSPYGVRSLRFKLGKVFKKLEVRSQKSKVRKLSPEELSFIEEATSEINDPDLKKVIGKTMGKAIAARTKPLY